MTQIILVEQDEITKKYYVYIKGMCVGKQYTIVGVIKQLLTEFWEKE